MADDAPRPGYIPADNHRIRVVGSLSAIFTAVAGEMAAPAHNAIIAPRRLDGDFNGLAQALAAQYARGPSYDYLALSQAQISQPLPDETAAIHAARMQVAGDMAAIVDAHDSVFDDLARLTMKLRVINAYRPGSVDGFHMDGCNRICCAYNAPATEGLRNEDASTRRSGNYFTAKPGTRPFSFRPGDIWFQRGGTDWEKQDYFIHRGPPSSGVTPRLLLVADLTRMPS